VCEILFDELSLEWKYIAVGERSFCDRTFKFIFTEEFHLIDEVNFALEDAA
jgi:hypothetical protein